MVEIVKYTVRTDDSLWNIMKKNGFPPRDWEKAFNASYNSSFKGKLKKQKRSPNLIYKGEVFFLPKYNPAQLEDMIRQLEHHYGKFSKHGKDVARFNSAVAMIDGDAKKSKRLIAKARKSLEWMDEVDKLRFSKDLGDPGRGLKFAKAIHQMTDRKRLSLEEHIMDLEKNLEVMDGKEAKAKVKKLQRLSKEVSSDLDNVTAEIKQLRNTLAKNLKRPY